MRTVCNVLAVIYALPVLAGSLNTVSDSFDNAGFQKGSPLVELWFRSSSPVVFADGSALYTADNLGLPGVFKSNADGSSQTQLFSQPPIGAQKIREAVQYKGAAKSLIVFVIDLESKLDRSGPKQSMKFFTESGTPESLDLDGYDIDQFRDACIAGSSDTASVVFVGGKSGSINSNIYLATFSRDSKKWIQKSITKLTSNLAERLSPRLNHDGSLICYKTNDSESKLYMYEPADDRRTLLLTGVGQYAFSADGRVLFYTINNDLYKASVTTDRSLMVTTSRALITDLASADSFFKTSGFNGGKNISCSSDGRFLAFISDKDYATADSSLGATKAYVLDSYTGNITCVSDGKSTGAYDALNIAVSPNGRYVSFAGKPDPLTNSYDVFTYSFTTNELPTERVLSSILGYTEISELHAVQTTEDGSKTLLVVKNGVRYDPVLIDNLTGKSFILKQGPSVSNYEYMLSLDGKVFVEKSGSAVNWYPLNDFMLDTAGVKKVNAGSASAVDKTGSTVAYIKDGSLRLWLAADESDRLIGSGCKSPLAVSANGNFITCLKAGGGIVAFGTDSADQRFKFESPVLSSITTFYTPSLSRNGRVLAFYDGEDNAVKVFDFFNESFVSDAALSGAEKPFVSASGAEVLFVKGAQLKSLRLEDGLVKDIEAAAGTYGFSAIIPSGHSVTFTANAAELSGRSGKYDLYQYYFERNNTAPSGVEKSGELKVDTLHELVVNVVATDDYDQDLDVLSVTAPSDGSFDYLQFYDGKSVYQSDRGFTGMDRALLEVVDSSGLMSRVAVDIEVLKSTISFAEGYVPSNPEAEGYDVALALGGNGVTAGLSLRESGAVVVFADPVYSDLKLSDDGSEVIVDNVTALGYEDVNVMVDGVKQVVRLEYGREFTLRTGWNLLGVPYEFTELGHYVLNKDVIGGWKWDGINYDEFDYTLSSNFKSGESYWLFALTGDDGKGLTFAPNRPAADSATLNDGESDDFFHVTVKPGKWNLVSPIGYGDGAVRGTTGAPVWGWSSDSYVYERPSISNGFWHLTPLNGYWQPGQNALNLVDGESDKASWKYE